VITIILIAFISDLSDGYLARKLNQITDLGKLIDPIGDKLFVFVLIIKFFTIGEVDAFYFWTILLRDVIIFTGGVIVKKMIGKVMSSNLLGKITIFSIGCYFLAILFGIKELFISQLLYLTSLTLSFLSVLGYAIRAIETVKWYKKNEPIKEL
jgi:CDP-diacylglycerol--glycerol-3-phosphate 3-phosphatidyltransferase